MHDEAHVVMHVRGHALVLGNVVRVEVEDRRRDRQAGQARFLFGFGQRHAREVAFAVGVAAQLQPAIELAVVREQHALAGAVDQPGRGGEVAGQAFAPERILGVVQQRDEARDRGGFGRPARGVVGKQAAVRRRAGPTRSFAVSSAKGCALSPHRTLRNLCARGRPM